MKLGMTSWHEIAKTPIESFSHDEAIDSQTYVRLMTDGYSAIASYITAGAQSAGVNIDSTTEERWRRLTCASYYIDEYIDTAVDIEQAHQLYEAGLSAALSDQNLQHIARNMPGVENANPLLLPSIISLKNSVVDTSPQQLEQLRHAALVINDAALKKAHTSDINTYAQILGQESDAMVDLYDYSATNAVSSQPAYATFSQTLHDIMRVAVYGDSTMDLRADYRQGITQVRPTPRAIGHLALQTIAPAWRAAQQPMTWHMLRQVKPRIIPTQ